MKANALQSRSNEASTRVCKQINTIDSFIHSWGGEKRRANERNKVYVDQKLNVVNSIEMMMWWWWWRWWEKRWQPFLHHIICGYNHLMSRYVRWSKQHSLTGIKAYFKWILIWSRYAHCTLLTVWLQIKQNDRKEKKFIYTYYIHVYEKKCDKKWDARVM